jgi:hypothetical protein
MYDVADLFDVKTGFSGTPIFNTPLNINSKIKVNDLVVNEDYTQVPKSHKYKKLLISKNTMDV